MIGKTYLFVSPMPFEGARVTCRERLLEIEQIGNEKVKKEKLYAFALLEKGLSSLGLDVNALSPHKDIDGKWRFDGIEASLSHSGELCCCAIAPHSVGVDVEAVRPVKERLIDAVLTQDERERLLQIHGEAKNGNFILMWTEKEAVFKSTGRLPIKDITSFSDDAARFTAAYNGKSYAVTVYPAKDICVIADGVELWPHL